MIVLNVIAWIILIISILAYTVETVREETPSGFTSVITAYPSSSNVVT